MILVTVIGSNQFNAIAVSHATASFVGLEIDLSA
jgi:hypothetical protein